MRNLTYVLILISLVSFTACKNVPSRIYNGNPIGIQVFIDSNVNKNMTSTQMQRYSQVAKYMSINLIKSLQYAGYKTELIGQKTDFKHAEATFLLEVKIAQYNYRPIGTFLKTSYILTKNKKILSKTHDCSTSRNWRHCVQKLNRDMIEVINQEITALKIQQND